MVDLIKEIEAAEMVLVAVGKAFERYNPDKEDYMGSAIKYYNSEIEADDVIKFYNDLELLVGKKDYFIASLCSDGIVYNSNLKRLRIVTPCGNVNMLQCGCEDVIDGSKVLVLGKKAVCEVCGQAYVPNVYGIDNYNEQGYLKQWNLYNIWLQRALSKRLLIIELGMDYTLSNVFKFPLERITLIGNKVRMIIVDEKFSQYPKEIADKAFSVTRNPMEYIGEYAYGRIRES